MKRHGNLWAKITAFENLLQAAKQAERGKRYKSNVLAFNHDFEKNILVLQSELMEKSYVPGGYRTFLIFEPKKRMISAAPYRDRVIHHALCNIIGPIFERTFVTESYANRKGFGTHKALKRFVRYARQSTYVLQCDIEKYFPSIDHEILKQILMRKIKCKDTIWLMNTIIDHSNPQLQLDQYYPGDDLLTPQERKRGLPVGNLSSQFFSNIYMNGFDHFIKEQLSIKSYVRYVDDFALFSHDYEQLQVARKEIVKYLNGLRIRIHPIKSQLSHTKHGANFLGFRILPDRIRIRSANLRRTRLAMDAMYLAYKEGRLSLSEITQSMESRAAHFSQGDTWRLREKLFSRTNFML